jgi:hypothetical protein|tara:strand:- start:260 stop:490 length:231 start_codon:yes stop_codon:yes gene_type:complete
MINTRQIARNLMQSYDRIPDITKPKTASNNKGFLTKKIMPKENNKNNEFGPLVESVEQYQKIKNLRLELRGNKTDV